jgi:hypothetical protein
MLIFYGGKVAGLFSFVVYHPHVESPACPFIG